MNRLRNMQSGLKFLPGNIREITKENIHGILQKEDWNVFTHVLEDAGTIQRDDRGKKHSCVF